VIRTALAVVLAAALLSISLPAVDAAAAERTSAQMDRAVDRISAAATDVTADDPGPTPRLAPRRVVDVRLPERSLTSARVTRVTVDGGGDAPAHISYALAGRTPNSHRIDAPLATPAGPIVLRASGEHTLVLRYVRRAGEPVVLVARRGSERPGPAVRTSLVPRPTILRPPSSRRGFKYWSATSLVHDILGVRSRRAVDRSR
jgi:hypothetical protein